MMLRHVLPAACALALLPALPAVAQAKRPPAQITITNARAGVMPRWGGRLDPVTIRMLAAYVHSLGGGEANPAPVPTAARP
jgi:mono/diheme cytochrome c family protein